MSGPVQGTTPGRPRTREASSRGSMLGPVVALSAGMVILALVLGGLGVGLGVPSGTATPSTTDASTPPVTPATPLASPSRPPSPVPASLHPVATASPELRDVSGREVADVPRYPGAIRVRYEEGVDGRISWAHLRYLSSAPLESVR
jgi:hypothetical protein